MAELVQFHLESTVPELEQMERIGLFTRNEIKKIIRKRTALEYLLRRRTKTKEDYLKYIQYELNVLSLIAKRRQRLGCELKKQEIDHEIAVRISRLFKAVIARNQNDEKLWLSEIEFCQRMKWHHTISSLFARMLQVHSDKPELWILAAKWEFEENNAPENARNLLQRALRFHSDSRQLWTEYFRMELMYTDLVIKRQEVLGLQEHNKDSGSDAVLEGKIALLVYEKATEAISDAEFAVSLIDVCRLFDFASELINRIFDDIHQKHPSNEVVLDAIAKRPLVTLPEKVKNAKEKGIKKKKVITEIEEKICASYENAVELARSEKMWSFYIEFVISQLNSAKKEKKKLRLLDVVLNVMERANSVDLLSCSLYVEWCKFLQLKGDEDLCCSVSLQAARKWPKNVSLWVLCLSVHIQFMKEESLISDILREAMENLPPKKSLPIWKLGMQWLSLCDPIKLRDYCEKGLHFRHADIRTDYLELIGLKEGIPAARELYQRLRYCYPISPELFKMMIRLENSQMKSSIKYLRNYYEDAIKEFGSSDVDLWINYLKLEKEHPDGDIRKWDMYHHRAMKTLDDHLIQSFTTRWTLYKLGKEHKWIELSQHM